MKRSAGLEIWSGAAALLLLVPMASGVVDVRLWIAPANSVSVAWAGAGGPFAPTSIGTSPATGGVGAHVYTTATVEPAGLGSLPAPGIATSGAPAAGEIYAILARTDNEREAGSAVRGMNLQLISSGDLSWDVAWIQWSGPAGAWRWETSSNHEGPEVTFTGGLGGPGRGWVLGSSADRLDRWDELVPGLDIGVGGILLGFIRTNSGTGELSIRLGSNGILHAEGTRVAFSDGADYILGGVGAHGRGYGVQLLVGAPPPVVRLDTVEPVEHVTSGGARLAVLGEELPEDVGLLVNGAALTDVVWFGPTKVSGVMPPNPAGLYDLVAIDGSGAVLAILPEAVEYGDATLLPPADIEVVHLGDRVSLRWSTGEPYAAIDVLREGSLVATLTGDSREFVDDLAGLPGTGMLEYELLSRTPDDRTGTSERFFAISPTLPATLPCPRVFTRTCPLSTVVTNVYGSEANEVQTAFSLTTPTTTGLAIRVLGRRSNLDGLLRARIRDAHNPGTILVDNIVLGDWAFSAVPSWRTGNFIGSLPAGDYLLGFYAEGGNPSEIHFALATCANERDLGPPFPCPPYPVGQARPFQCGEIPPEISQIVVTRPATPQFIRGRPGDLVRRISVQASAFDASPNVIVQYHYDFGDGQQSISASATAIHHYPAYGTYPLTVTVLDLYGQTATSSVSVKIKPFVSPPPAGFGPIISHLTPPAGQRSYIPDITRPGDPQVYETFQVLVTPAAGFQIPTGDPTAVQMRMRHPVTDAILVTMNAVKSDPSDPDPQTFWKATFNMSALPRLGSVVLEVTARDTQPALATPLRSTVQLCPVPDAFFRPFITTVITYDPVSRQYTLEGTITPATLGSSLTTGSSGSLPYGIAALLHQVDLKFIGTIHLQNRRWFGGTLRGEFAFKGMSSPLWSQTWSTNPHTTSFLECPDFGILYRMRNIKLLDKTWTKRLIDNQTLVGPVCLLPPSAPVLLCLTVKGTVELQIFAKAFLDLDFYIRFQSPFLEVDSCLRPSAGLGSGTFASVTVTASVFRKWFKFASATGYLYPTASLELPTRIDILPFPMQVTVRACLRLDVDYRLTASYWWGHNRTYDSGRRDINGLNNLSWFGGCGQNPCGLFDGPEDGPLPPPDPAVPKIKYPTIATSPDGQTSLMVYVRDIDPDPVFENPELYYSVSHFGGPWSPAAPLWLPADQNPDTQPQLTFISDTDAILVWTHNRMTYAESELLPETAAGFNELFRSAEIYTAGWNTLSGWSGPTAVTDDLNMHAYPQVARIPGAAAAMCLYMSSDGPVLDELTGAPLGRSAVYAVRIAAGGVPETPVRLSAPPPAESYDFNPALAFAPQAPQGYAVWVSEDDAGGDRGLLYAHYDGATWSATELAIDGLDYPGVDSPSLALSSPTKGVLAFTVSAAADSSGVLPLGVDEEVYVSQLDGDGDGGLLFSGTLPVSGPPRCAQDSLTSTARAVHRAQYPSAHWLGGERFAVGMRAFTVDGEVAPDGEPALAAIDYDDLEPRWALRTLLRDDAIDLEIAFAPGLHDRIRTVRSTTTGPGLTDSLVLADFLLLPDLAVEDVEVSDRHAPPGTLVDLRVTLRNVGLRTPTPGQGETAVQLELLDSAGLPTPVGTAVPLVFTASPDSVQTVDLQLVMPIETARLRITAAVLGEEVVTTNNTLELDLGVLPPVELRCGAELSGGEAQVIVTWTNADAYEAVRVYRAGQLVTELPGDATVFVGRAEPSGAQPYALRGVIGRAVSSPTAAVCTVFSGSSVVWQGFPVDALGDAQLSVDWNEHLVMSNLDAPGENGAALHLGSLEALRIDWLPLDSPETTPTGARLELRAFGATDGGPDRSLGMLHVVDVGSTLDITPDFSGVGAGTYRILLYNRGALLASVPGLTGSAGQASVWPDSGQIGHFGPAADVTLRWTKPAALTLAGGLVVVGDELRMIAQDHAESFEAHQRLDLLVAGLPRHTLTRAVPTPLRVAGDMNCDGRIDFNDIDGFVLTLIGRDSYYAVHPTCNYDNGDTNGDGSVDFADIDAFICCLIAGSCDGCGGK